ncbi:MAG: glycosyltransferase family 2 protein [Gemmatimonadetes bacterium]|nr:glycosyltransferase family 2 protein [Gemmatimonadota bacterium]
MIYVCIPVHDEARTVGVLLWKIRKVMRELARDYEILVLDDASADETAATLARYRRVLPLSVIRSDQRLGYARSLERLLREATKRAAYPKRDVAITLQGDFTDDPAHLATLVKTIEGGADVVAGCVAHTVPGPRPVWWARRLAPWALGGVHRRAPVSDPTSGYRAYRAIVLKKVLREEGGAPLLTTEGWAANVELLGLIAPHARRIEEAPLEPRYDLRERPTRVRALPVLRELFRLRGRPWFTPTPVV